MRGSVNFKFQVFVPYLILPEILCLCIETQQQGSQQAKQNKQISFDADKMRGIVYS